jgi:hypothetical protein
MMAKRRRFGRVRQLPSGRWQARYRGADALTHAAPHTFVRKTEAERWLLRAEAMMIEGRWIEPSAGSALLGEFAATWVQQRANLRPKTRQLYEGLTRLHIAPTLGEVALSEVTPARVRAWRSGLLAGGTGPVTVAKAYRLLRTIMQTAVEDDLVRVNPCQIKGAGVERSPERPVLSIEEVYAVVEGLPERLRLLVLLATFCSLRWSELAVLTRREIDADEGFVQVRVTVSELKDGSRLVGPTRASPVGGWWRSLPGSCPTCATTCGASSARIPTM